MYLRLKRGSFLIYNTPDRTPLPFKIWLAEPLTGGGVNSNVISCRASYNLLPDILAKRSNHTKWN